MKKNARKPARKPRKKAAPRRPPRALTSASGYQIVTATEARRELLMVRAPNGRLCLKILLLPEGPIVEVEGQSLRVASAGAIRLDCEELAVNVRGDIAFRAGGVIDSEAHAHRLRARLGDVRIAANDDVTLDGERIRLNSPQSAPPASPAPPAPPPAALPPPPAHDSD